MRAVHLVKPSHTAVHHFLQCCDVSKAERKQRPVSTGSGQRQQSVELLPYRECRLHDKKWETHNT